MNCLNSYMRYFVTARFSVGKIPIHVSQFRLPPCVHPSPMLSPPRHQTFPLTASHHSHPPSCMPSSGFFFCLLSFVFCSVFHRLRYFFFCVCLERLQGVLVGRLCYKSIFLGGGGICLCVCVCVLFVFALFVVCRPSCQIRTEVESSASNRDQTHSR